MGRLNIPSPSPLPQQPKKASYRSYPAILILTSFAFFFSWTPQFLLPLFLPPSHLFIKAAHLPAQAMACLSPLLHAAQKKEVRESILQLVWVNTENRLRRRTGSPLASRSQGPGTIYCVEPVRPSRRPPKRNWHLLARKLSLVRRKKGEREERLDQLFPPPAGAAVGQKHFPAGGMVHHGGGQKHSINPCSCTAQECQGTVV